MNQRVVRGQTKSAIAALLKRNEITRLGRGLYVWGQPTPLGLLSGLHAEFPWLFASGLTAAQLLLNEPLTFPLHLAGLGALPPSSFYSFTRTTIDSTLSVSTYRVLNPLVALSTVDAELAKKVFEHIYSSKKGRSRLEAHRAALKQIPTRTQKILSSAALFTDSGAEIMVARELTTRGLNVECNVRIGRYYWDIVLPDLKVAVEINSFEYHSAGQEWIRDHWKNNEAVLTGWCTLRYTGHCVAHHLNYVIDQITHAAEPDFDKRYYSWVGYWHKGAQPPPLKPWEQPGYEHWAPLSTTPPDGHEGPTA